MRHFEIRPIGRKGQTGIEIAIIGAIVLLTIVISIILPVFLLKIHVTRVSQIEYGYDNAAMSILTLLADKNVYRYVSLYAGDYPNDPSGGYTRVIAENIIKGRLDFLVPSKCYSLTYTNASGDQALKSDSLDKGQCETEYAADAYVALPPGQDRMRITLRISDKSLNEILEAQKKICCQHSWNPIVKCATISECSGSDWMIQDSNKVCSNPATDCVQP